jgi:hypothetical protein
MFGLLLRAFAMIFLGLVLTACGTRPRPMPEVQQIYEIRGVMVTANAGISRKVMRGIKQRLDKAIRNTHRPIPMPRAVMNIHVVSVTRDSGYDGNRTQTELSVALTDVPSGQAVLVRSFLIYSFSLNERTADDAAAEAIAARLRVEYALAQPVIRDPAADLPAVSTRMRGDVRQPIVIHREKPLVIPLKTAPIVGVDQDPVLNSRTKVRPAKKDVVLPDAKLKLSQPTQTENVLESGAKAKVVIKPKAAEPADGEPCVETMDKKC